jgi:hypothetical protein
MLREIHLRYERPRVGLLQDIEGETRPLKSRSRFNGASNSFCT